MRRLNPAEKLSDVLDLLAVRCYSGLLSVERFEGRYFEEGEIYFEKGQPVYAHYKQISGKEAFACLKAWQQVYFAFDKNAACLASRDASLPSHSPVAETARLSQPLSSSSLHWDTVPRARVVSGSPSSGVEQWVPHRVEVGLDVLSLPLTRTQRAVYLLVDGRRTVVDLARCTGKSSQEVVRLLCDLQILGLLLV